MTVIPICRSLTQIATPLVSRALKQKWFRFANHPLSRLNPVRTAVISQPFAVRTHCALKGRVVLKERERHGLTLGFYALGGFLLTALIVHGITDCEGNERIMPLDLLPPNPQLKHVPDGLVEDPEHKEWFIIKGELCRFRVQLTANGQLIWRSFCVVYKEDVQAIANFYKKRGDKGRSLHINTGIHADPTGVASIDGKSGDFTGEDIVSLKGYVPVSFHIISSVFGPVTPEIKPDVDILDAWCFSATTKDFSKLSRAERDEIGKDSIPRYQLMDCFMSLQDLGYQNTLIPNIDYMEMGSLKQDVIDRLKEDSFCYVYGIGGLGKSRVATEITKDIKDDGDQSEYGTTVFVSLKSKEEKNDFFAKVKKDVSERNDKIALKKYFSRLHDLARVHHKKIFVVVDNIDTPEELEVLQNIFDNIKEFCNPSGDSTFKLLVTGRLSLSDFWKKNKLDKLKDREITIATYYTEETCWLLFINNFLRMIHETSKQSGRDTIEQHREVLLGYLKQVEYNSAIAIPYSRGLGLSYQLGRFKPAMRFLSARFKAIIARGRGLDDYSHDQAIEDQISLLDERRGGKAREIFEIFSLTSAGSISYSFFGDILETYYNCETTDGLDDIFYELGLCGLVQEIAPGTGVYRVPPFYHRIIQHSLSGQYTSRAGDIDKIFSIVLETLEKKQSETTDAHVKHWVGFFNSVRQVLKVDQPLYNEICSKCYATMEKLLPPLKLEDLKSEFNNLLSTLSDTPGYSIDPVLHKYMKGEELKTIASDLICRANEKQLKGKLPEQASFAWRDVEYLLLSLNNLYVFSQGEKQQSSQIKKALEKLIKTFDCKNIEFEKLKNIIKGNIADPKMDPQKLTIFPQIHFYEVLAKYQLKAQKWKKENPLNGKTANMSRAQLRDGLRTLIPYLIQEKGVEVIDLSHNQLGYNKDRAVEAVRDLLKSPGSLKELNLSDNTLYYQGFRLILDGLRENTSLETLVLNNNSLENMHIIALCTVLKNHKNIMHIKLHHNRFSQTGIAHLKQLMKDNLNIQSITTECAVFPWHNIAKLERDDKGDVKQVPYDGESAL